MFITTLSSSQAQNVLSKIPKEYILRVKELHLLFPSSFFPKDLTRREDVSSLLSLSLSLSLTHFLTERIKLKNLNWMMLQKEDREEKYAKNKGSMNF